MEIAGSATTIQTAPRIDGGRYRAIDTKDGWFILKDIPSFARVPKGVKNAPEDIGEDWMRGAVAFGQRSYSENKIANPVHITHNDVLGTHNPEFAGFFKPTRVGTLKLDGKDEPVVFSDLKVKGSVFSKMKAGELPYLSPEINNWSKPAISSVALLDSQPPHFRFPMLTGWDVVDDPSAVFSADLPKGVSVARFSDGLERLRFAEFDPREEKKDGDEKGDKDGGNGEKMEAADDDNPNVELEEAVRGGPEQTGDPHGQCCAHCDAVREDLDKIAKMMGYKPGGNSMADPVKPDATPAEQPVKTPVAKMSELDPKLAAKFASLEDANAKLAERLDARDRAEKARERVVKALAALEGYQIGDKTKAMISVFAERGQEELDKYVEAVKESAVKETPSSLMAAELAGVKSNDPALSKFAEKGPEELAKAARFAAEYRQLKNSPAGRGMSITEDQWISAGLAEAAQGGNV